MSSESAARRRACRVTLDLGERERRASLNQTLRVVLSRLAALCLFAMGILYWGRLIGVVDADWRFDLMPTWWRIAAPVLAVLYPVAGAGVWMVTSWGIVIWVLIFVIELLMHVGFQELFGPSHLTVGLHLLGLSLLLALRVNVFLEQRRR